jgi:hypothetical protein
MLVYRYEPLCIYRAYRAYMYVATGRIHSNASRAFLRSVPLIQRLCGRNTAVSQNSVCLALTLDMRQPVYLQRYGCRSLKVHRVEIISAGEAF